nr:hypothetical protein [Tanacetum cinerariifolium]
MQPVTPPSPDYVPGPEHPSSPNYVLGPEHPPSLVEIPYVPELEYPEYLAPSDNEEPLEDQHLPNDASPITALLGYVADSDPNEDPKEDPEDDHADYPADGGDGDDEPSDDDDDDDEDEEPFEDEEDDEEEEEHLAPADSSTVPIVDLVLPAKDTEAFEADEPAPTPRSPHNIIPLSRYVSVGHERLSDLSHPSIMFDASSVVTYTSVYTDSEPWRYYKEDSDEVESSGVIVYGYDGLPMQPVTPPSPDYVPGPEHPS